MAIRTSVKTFSLSPVALALASVLVAGSATAADASSKSVSAASAAAGTEKADSVNNLTRSAVTADSLADNNAVSVNHYASNKGLSSLGLITVDGQQFSKDEIGYNRVYTRDIVNLYKGKKEIETYRGNTVSDLFSGMTGIYSGDSRNSGALDPNIRGVQGEGRIPVTVDGTEQSITVWRGYAGVNNRNYVDPNLISSIYVEKGPSLNPAVRSGIGGSVAMKTLDTDDIVAQGEKYGMEIKLETGDNSITPRRNIYVDSMDYRDIAHPEAAQGGMWRVYFDDSDRMDPRTSGKNHFFNDKAVRIAAATRQDKFDLMAAYAWRNKGNYFSGKRGAEKYGYRIFASEQEFQKFAHGQPNLDPRDPYIAQIGLIQLPGREVTNTSLVTESWLLKGTLKLTNSQKLKLGYRQTETHFGDIMPSRIIGPLIDMTGKRNQVVEWPQSWVKQKAVNLDYAWNPEDNKWLDLKASLWTTLNDSKTNSAGGAPGDALYFDKVFNDKYTPYFYAHEGNYALLEEQRELYKEMFKDYPKPTSADSDTPNTNGRFNTIDGAAYYARNNRMGFNLSNRMQLTSMLNLTVMGDFQYETLKSNNAFGDFFANPGRYDDERTTVQSSPWVDHIGLPRNGKRDESNFAFNFNLAPVDWLVITAGARYTAYTVQDDYVKDFLETLEHSRPVRINTGIEYREDMVDTTPFTQEDAGVLRQLEEAKNNGGSFWDYLDLKRSLVSQYGEDYIDRLEGIKFVQVGNEIRKMFTTLKIATWMKDKYGNYNMKDNPYINGTFKNEEVINPVDGEKIKRYYKGFTDSTDGRTITGSMDEDKIGYAYKQTGHGWVPLASTTVFFTPHSRAYVRYSESLRYPSIFEGTLGFSNTHASQPDYGRLGYLWKPEHAKNWEVGYVYSFGHLLPHTRYADFRMNYYHNTTENIIDRDAEYLFHQYDKLLLSGVELQGRFDTGRLFGDLGVVRTIKDQVCDSTAAFIDGFSVDDYFSGKKRAPDCQNGGMSPNGYLANMIPPRWSVVANLGSRFFNEKLEVGTRFTYYSRVYDTRYKSFDGSGFPASRITDAALRWQPVAVYDAYVRYKFNKNLIAELTGNNLTNLYYLDPMSRSYVPAPGRTIRMSLTAKF